MRASQKEVKKALMRLLNIEDENDPTLLALLAKAESTNRSILNSKLITRKEVKTKNGKKPGKIKLKVSLSPEAKRVGMDVIAKRTLAGLDRKKVRIKLPLKKQEPLEPLDDNMTPEDEASLSVYEKRKRAGARALRRAGYESGADAASRTLANIPKGPRGRR